MPCDAPRDRQPGVDELIDLIGQLEPGVLIAVLRSNTAGTAELAVRPLGPDDGAGVDALIGLSVPPGTHTVAVALTGTSPDHAGELRIDGAVDRAGRRRYRVRDRTGRPVVDSEHASGRLVDALEALLDTSGAGPRWTTGEHPANDPPGLAPHDDRAGPER